MTHEERARHIVEKWTGWIGYEGLADDVVDALRTVEREAYERAAKVAETEAEFRGEGDGEIWIASKIAQSIRDLAVKEGEG